MPAQHFPRGRPAATAPRRRAHSKDATSPRRAHWGLALNHLATLDDQQLADAIANLDAAEIVEKNKTHDLQASALWYAKHGWPVFPLKPRGKQPLTRHGFKDATTDPAIIRGWWAATPDANIGVPTGPDGCGLDVIDVDGPEGFRSLADLRHTHCRPDCCAEEICPATGELPPVHAITWTPGGPGQHYWITATGDGNASRYEPGLDYRGRGGYVVVPPSLGLSGARYTWIARPEGL